ncbi:MAG TPA: DUF3301 domain-containing protein [Thiotrichaceae bacterium]|jgi:hypothetical protein|nr:DUF3301 domain-containing protein [Thiotrichaceae bacterium]HIM08374.1 DUF3301 domain-containing protein [Gammaproteobacteria bacterium]
MSEIIFLLLLGLVIWFWQDTLRAREIAVSRARRYCQEIDFQFLDETVALSSLKPGRNYSGNFAFHRYYQFEFSLDGHNRFNGTAYLIGNQLQSIQLDHPDGIIIEDKNH